MPIEATVKEGACTNDLLLRPWKLADDFVTDTSFRWLRCSAYEHAADKFTTHKILCTVTNVYTRPKALAIVAFWPKKIVFRFRFLSLGPVKPVGLRYSQALQAHCRVVLNTAPLLRKRNCIQNQRTRAQWRSTQDIFSFSGNMSKILRKQVLQCFTEF